MKSSRGRSTTCSSAERGRPIKVSLVNKGHARSHSAGEAIVLAYDPAKAVALPKGKLAAD